MRRTARRAANPRRETGREPARLRPRRSRGPAPAQRTCTSGRMFSWKPESLRGGIRGKARRRLCLRRSCGQGGRAPVAGWRWLGQAGRCTNASGGNEPRPWSRHRRHCCRGPRQVDHPPPSSSVTPRAGRNDTADVSVHGSGSGPFFGRSTRPRGYAPAENMDLTPWNIREKLPPGCERLPADRPAPHTDESSARVRRGVPRRSRANGRPPRPGRAPGRNCVSTSLHRVNQWNSRAPNDRCILQSPNSPPSLPK